MNTQSPTALALNRHLKITAIALGLLLIAGLVWYKRADAAAYSRPIAFATTITVNTPLDITDPNDNLCSLREAIIAANNNNVPSGPGVKECPAGTGLDSIVFNLPAGPLTIAPTSPLPIITDPVIIDGNMGGATRVELFGGNAGPGANGLSVSAGSSTIRSLVINHFLGSAIVLTNSANNTNNIVQNCYIGTDASGTHDEGNGLGITVSSSNNLIGGTTPTDCNVISANGKAGVMINSQAQFNQVQGNYIGTTAPSISGISWLGNGGPGVQILGGANNNNIGGPTAVARNVISGNAQRGVYLTDSGTTGNRIEGNFIGTDDTGTVELPTSNSASNGNSGIAVYNGASNTQIINNVIAGMKGHGIEIAFNTNNCSVRGNLIGTNVSGTAAILNLGVGVLINYSSANNTVGGAVAGDRNIISANAGGGVAISNASTGNTVQGNFIGTNAAGTANLGNGLQGVVVIASPNNAIGGTATGAGNLIAFNNQKGVDILGATSIKNRVLGNRIFSNGALGIDLKDDGVTANDKLDADAGPNNLQNFPVLTSITGTTITGSLNSSKAYTIYPVRIEFFASSVCDASGNGEGEVYLGATKLLGPGSFTFSFTSGKPVITATATDANGNTSEFSSCTIVPACPPVITLSPSLPNGTTSNAYNQTVTASPASNYNYVVTSGALPTGVNINSSTGAITGNPTTPGKYPFTITATDANGCSASQSYTVFIICAGSNCPCYQVPALSAMVNWWPFDEVTGSVANDIRGATDNVAAYGAGSSAPVPTAGMVGKALLFDGVNDFLQTPNEPDVNIGGSCATGDAEDFTIDVWIMATGGGQPVIVDKRGNLPSLLGYVVFLLNGRIGIQINGLEYYSPTTLPALTDNQWHFIAVTVRRCPTPQARFYADGALIHTVALAASASNSLANGNPLFIGNRSLLLGGGLPFNGRLDELEIFKSALTEDELAGIYLAGASGKCRCVQPPQLNQMFGWWPLDGNASEIRSGFNGTIFNGGQFKPGMAQQGWKSGGQGSVIEVVNPNFPKPAQLTIDAWVKIDAQGSFDMPIAYKGDSVGNGLRSYAVFITGNNSNTPSVGIGHVVVYIYDCVSGKGQIVPSKAQITPGSFRQITVTASGKNGQIRIYIDGKLDTVEPQAFAPVDCQSPTLGFNFQIGGVRNTDYFFNGVIDEVEIFDVVLTEAEIQSIAYARCGGKCKSTCNVTINPPSLPSGVIGNFYSQQLTQTGCASGAIWSLVGGALPNGMSLNPVTGLISGIPDTSNTSASLDFTVSVTCASGCTTTQQYTLNLAQCPSSLSATNATFGAAGGNGLVGVTTNCAWTTISNTPWIGISPPAGFGNGTVNYSVTANSSGALRSGTITVAGQTFTIIQTP